MSRVQVLDVGDRVKVVSRLAERFTGREGIVVEKTADVYGLAMPELPENADVSLGWIRGHLERIGGDLQVGDFVRIAATTNRLLALDGYKALVFRVFPQCVEVLVLQDGQKREYFPNELIRITKAEALA